MVETKDIILICLTILNAVAVFLVRLAQLKETKRQRMANESHDRDIKELRGITEDILKNKRKEDNKEYYCHYITQKFEKINLGGHILPMDVGYVKQQVKKYVATELREWLAEPITDFQTAFEKEYRNQSRNLKLFITGLTGCGKTTLLKWIALQCASSDKNFFSFSIPIFLSKEDLNLYPDNSFLASSIGQLTVKQLKSTNFDPSFFDDAYEKNEVIFLFDGLDEVTNKNLRQKIIQWILRQNTRKNPLLITTRQLDPQDVIPHSVYRLKEFAPPDIEKAPTNWLKNTEINMTIAPSAADTRKIQLLKIIQKNESLPQLEQNPLLLKIIAMLQIKRDQLKWPMKQHELYEEYLKLVIELNYQNNSYVQASEIGEKVKNCLKYLSNIAFFLVVNKHSEIEQTQIKKILLDDENQMHSFLNDMVNITGLLYESKGRYGFLSPIFQEYLAARYFAREKKPKNILEYLDNDYRPEIFKLYANLAAERDIKKFFKIIIKKLKKKGYWKQLSLLEDCLLNVPDKNPQNEDENTRYKIEMQFAKKVLKLLHQLSYKKANEELIISLYPHYPLYLYASQFIDDARDLFDNAKHPFTQSIASTILHSSDKNPQGDLDKAKLAKAELINRLKNRIDEFEKQQDKTPQAYIDFILQNSNTFPLILASRKNILDFNYGLEKLKSGELFFNFLILHTLESIVDTLSSGEVLKLLNLADLREILEFLEVQKFLEKIELSVGIDLLTLRDFLKLEGFMKLRIDMGDIRIFIEPKYFDQLRRMVDEYEKQIKSQLTESKEKINTWVDLTTARLHKLTNQEIRNYFPGTTEEDIKKFRNRTK
jgi:energy-coupling factor transporter ATP-binding protein EcfA2